jgi:hypothetical protein
VEGTTTMTITTEIYQYIRGKAHHMRRADDRQKVIQALEAVAKCDGNVFDLVYIVNDIFMEGQPW